jgi:hypothetical protein
MKARRNVTLFGLGMGLLIVAVLILPAGGHMGATRFNYGTHNLIGASPEEVGRFAQQYAAHQIGFDGGDPEVLLSRAVTREEIAALDIACLPSAPTIEAPPLMLVILRGRFRPIDGPAFDVTKEDVPATTDPSYVAYVFDVWSATATFLGTSPDGTHFRKALQPLSASTSDSHGALVCPTELDFVH